MNTENEEQKQTMHGVDALNMKPFIKGLRVDIDRSIKNAQTLAALLNRGVGGRNVALAITHLEDAKMRLGLALGDLGHKLPEEYRDEA